MTLDLSSESIESLFAKPLQETNLNNQQPAGHYVKQMTIQRGAVFQAPLQALQELALLAHPATEAKVVTREGVDQHLLHNYLIVHT